MAGWSIFPILVTGFKHQNGTADRISSQSPGTIWANTKARTVAPNDYNLVLQSASDQAVLAFDRVITTNCISVFTAINQNASAACQMILQRVDSTTVAGFQLLNAGAYLATPAHVGNITSPLTQNTWKWLGVALFADDTAGYYRMGVGSAWEMDIQTVDTRDNNADINNIKFLQNAGGADNHIEATVACVPALRFSASSGGASGAPVIGETITRGAATARCIGYQMDDGSSVAGWILLDTISADFALGAMTSTGTWAATSDTLLSKIPDDADFLPELFGEVQTVTSDVSSTLTPSVGPGTYSDLDDLSNATWAAATATGQNAVMEITDQIGVGIPYFIGMVASTQIDGVIITDVEISLVETVSGDAALTTHTPGATFEATAMSIGAKPKTAVRLTAAEQISMRAKVTFN